jgi:hypothetical protein
MVVKEMIEMVSCGQYTASLILDNLTDTAELIFQQDSEFRTDDVLTLFFHESNPDTIKNSISYRISSTQQMNMLV